MTNTAQGYESFKIPVERVEELQKRVEKINKRAAKLGTPPVSLILTENFEEHSTTVGGRIASMRRSPVMSWTSREVLLKGETPKLNGWEFVSVVMHRPAGNEFINVMDTTLDLSDFRFTDKHCDHCNKARVRNATFLVRHDDGQIKQVGSSCLEDYTGVKSPQAHAKQLENIFSMFHELRGGGWTEGRTTRKFFVQEWLAWVSYQMRTDGRYIGRNRSYDTGEATTGERAKRTLLGAVTDPNAAGPNMEDYDRAEAAIAWVRSDEGYESINSFSPEFGAQLTAACASDDQTVDESRMNIIAPAIVMHERYIKDHAAPKATAQYLGTVGQKLTVEVIMTRSHMFENAYGTFTTVYNFQDAQGNGLVWFASRDQGFEKGETLTLTGTVKAHDTDRRTGEPQTVLTRCKTG
jgi:hypothetical protein